MALDDDVKRDVGDEIGHTLSTLKPEDIKRLEEFGRSAESTVEPVIDPKQFSEEYYKSIIVKVSLGDQYGEQCKR